MGSLRDGKLCSDGSAFDGHASATLLRVNGRVQIGKVDEGKTTRFAGNSVVNEFDVLHVTESAEDVMKSSFFCRYGEVKDADAC